MRQVTRYQGWPGQATAYMVGRLGILNARVYATNALGEKFSLKDFHYQVMWLRECEFHDKFADNYILPFNSAEAFLNSDRTQLLFFFPSTTLYYTFTYQGQITKNVKETRKK